MKEGNIDNKIQSLKEWTKTDYEVPKDKTNEYVRRILKDEEAYLYLIRERNLKIETVEHFRLGLSEKKELAIPIYKEGKIIDYKFRTLPPKEKGFRRVPNTQTWVFNGDEGFKEGKEKGEIIICEGEIDLISLWQAGFKNVISLVGGAGNLGPWIKELDEIETIYVNLDSDNPGKKAARKLAERIGIEKCINVTLPEKDPNDFFKKYISEDYGNVLLNSDKFPIEDVVRLKDLFEEVKANPQEVKDFVFPFKSMQALTGGFSKENVIAIAGPTSHGKSSFVWNIFAKLADQGVPVLYMPLEDRMKHFGRRIFNIISGVGVWKFNSNDWDILKKKLISFPFYVYSGGEKFNLEVFESIIERGKKLYGIDIFCVDHIHFLANRGSQNYVQEVAFIMREIIQLSKKYHVTIFVVVQLTKNPKGGDEEWKKMPSMNAISDSVKIIQDAHIVMMIYRDVDQGTPSLQVAIKKNREGGFHMMKDDFFSYDMDLETGIISERLYEE